MVGASSAYGAIGRRRARVFGGAATDRLIEAVLASAVTARSAHVAFPWWRGGRAHRGSPTDGSPLGKSLHLTRSVARRVRRPATGFGVVDDALQRLGLVVECGLCVFILEHDALERVQVHVV